MRVLYGLLGLLLVWKVEGSYSEQQLLTASISMSGSPSPQRLSTSRMAGGHQRAINAYQSSVEELLSNLDAKVLALRTKKSLLQPGEAGSPDPDAVLALPEPVLPEVDTDRMAGGHQREFNAYKELADQGVAERRQRIEELMAFNVGDQSAAAKRKLEASLTKAGFSGFNYSGASVTAHLDGADAASIDATVVRLKAYAAFAGTPAAIELQQLMALANPATMKATVEQRIRDFGASLAGYNLDVNAQKAGVTDRPASKTAQALLDWLAPKVSAAMITKIAALAVGSGVQGLLDFRNSVFVLLSNGALVDGSKPDRGVQRFLKPLCDDVGQVNPLLSGESLPTLSIEQFSKLLVNYVVFGR